MKVSENTCRSANQDRFSSQNVEPHGGQNCIHLVLLVSCSDSFAFRECNARVEGYEAFGSSAAVAFKVIAVDVIDSVPAAMCIALFSTCAVMFISQLIIMQPCSRSVMHFFTAFTAGLEPETFSHIWGCAASVHAQY